MKRGKSISILNKAKKLYVVIDDKEKVLYMLIRAKDNEIAIKLNVKEVVRLSKCIVSIWIDDFKNTKRIDIEDSRDRIELNHVIYKKRELCKIELFKYIGHYKMEAEYYYDKVTLDKEGSRELFSVLVDYGSSIA